ncbi:MAG: hypothetical protein RL641_143 [Candidatus Parcubacteria bacterium]|jgi:thymidylate synthase ThyX
MQENQNTETPSYEIFVVDHLGPQEVAMAQALYSRDPRSVIEHLKVIEEKGPEAFMGKYYVEYGHKSIGDCGSTTIFIENVSMLVAKAVQDWSLYSGQEASTRYLDMSKQSVLNPIGTPAGQAIQNRWMAFYEKALAVLIAELEEQYPRKEGEKEIVYSKAIKAKAFDIARGFLPAGITTFVSWHTNLRQAADHLKEMRHHPLKEVRDIAVQTLSKLIEKYPSSFSHEILPDDEQYLGSAVGRVSYLDLSHNLYNSEISELEFSAKSNLNSDWLNHYSNVLTSRPKKSELPKQLRICGGFSFEFLLDFGSFRDLQRQRSVIQPMPLLTTHYGFEPWYLEQLPDSLREEAVELIKEQADELDMLTMSKTEKQYYIAMGFRVHCVIEAPLPAAVYIAELRAGQTVHPTLRVIAQQMGAYIKESVRGIALYYDESPDEWSTKRGKQDIIKKE